MERLSKRCMVICLGAVGCLGLAIAMAPRVERAPVPLERLEMAPSAHGAAGGYRPVQNCTGGESVNCHTRGNQAGL